MNWKDYFENDFFSKELKNQSNKNENLEKKINVFPFEIIEFKIKKIDFDPYYEGEFFIVKYIQRLGYLSFLEIYYDEKPYSYEYDFNIYFSFKDISFLTTFSAGSIHLPGGDPFAQRVSPLTIITFPVDEFNYLSATIEHVKQKNKDVKIFLIWNAYKINKRKINKVEEEEFAIRYGVDYSFEVSSKQDVEYCLKIIANILYNNIRYFSITKKFSDLNKRQTLKKKGCIIN